MATQWKGSLDDLPSTFARLVYLGSLWDVSAGCYRDPAISPALGEESANRMIRAAHNEAFAAWIMLDLRKQEADLREYIDIAGGGVDALRKIQEAGLYERCLPPSTRALERQLFARDLDTVVSLMSARA